MSVHVIGAGVAGLAAACQLTEAGHHVILFEAAKTAGGRARSHYDNVLGCRIDNGNHLLLSGNISTLSYLHRIGAKRSLTGPAGPVFPFHDLRTGEDWTLRLNQGSFPWWLFSRRHRVPGTRLHHYLGLLKIRKAKPADLVAPLLAGTGPLYTQLLELLAVSALNTSPHVAAAAALRSVFEETLELGGYATIPRYARIGLSETFVDPALDWLRQHGADIRLGERVTEISPGQATVLAVPPWAAAELVPGLLVPNEFESIYNLHFKYALPPGEAGFWGFIGGMTEWVFAHSNVLSVTISAASRYADMSPEDIAAKVWSEIASAFSLSPEIPIYRAIWEKRATMLATPAQMARRPKTRTANPNLMLAGDWTDTGLPATIEGAIRSGNAAALALMSNFNS
ncbi:hypothetical protein GCM10010909_22950 [Acidocella aquatica]|uniref:Amine oxidase domain-containing protein n=1 Tax=Acidocella aquatica TaxID=1922313 RepID=A0ABQ6A571_9PROT|nr:hydroxysqualene dehydroxylase HpnE [Acidocella aquatica]GLR67614.1 hypothetical protein GCM10010909_22950 [Acidocella aquatica]